jgi:hypothetical protein
MSDWKIARRGGACSSCERVFDEDEPHVSKLFLREGEPLREDQCQECFAKDTEGEEIWWWRTRHRSGKKRGLQLDLEAIEALFLSLEGKTDPKVGELRYVLCLILMRKRRLKIDRIVRDAEGEAMIVRRPRRKEGLRVAVHEFSPERMDELRARLVRLFDGGEGDVEGPTGEPEATPEAPTEAATEAAPEDDPEPASEETPTAETPAPAPS